MAICGQPVKSRPGKTCTNLASRDVQGVKCCGKHIGYLVRKNRTNDVPPPPFVPFDCGICMDECGRASASCKTICNHRFHKACLSKWEHTTKSGGNAFTCPMCRKELPSKIPTTVSNERAQRRHQLELLMASLRDLNDANANVTVAHLEDLISHGGFDAVASAVDGIVAELSYRPRA